jgi:hypothetical protein
MVISLARVIFDSSRWTRCEMGSDWLSQGQLGLAATVLAGAVLVAIVLACAVLACAVLARAAAASGNKTDKDAAMMAGGGIRRARRPPGRGLITGISFIEPSLDSICRPFSIGGYPPRKLRRPA